MSETNTLSASEQAHFETGGETPIESTTEVENTGTEHELVGQTTEGAEEVVDEAQSKPTKLVPLAALHEERQRNKEMREKIRIGEERLNQLAQVVQQRLQPQQQQPEIPAVDVDPVAHFKAENEQLRRDMQAMGQPLQAIQQRIAEQEHFQRARVHMNSQVAAFAQEKPDWGDAVRHVQQADVQALMALGHDQMAAEQMVTQHHDQLVMNLLQQGANVPERIYALAQAKGYAPKAAQASGQQKLQQLQKGAAAAKSLGSGGGVTNKLSLEALAAMPADEFAKTVGDDAAWRKLMGG